MAASSLNNRPFILASGSPRRKKLLKRLGFSFKVVPSAINETYDLNESFHKIVQNLALAKAREVSPSFSSALVLGADTLVAYNNELIGKPKNRKDASRILKKLSGSTHQVLTGVALVKTKSTNEIAAQETFVETTSVTFGRLDKAEIQKYISTGRPMDKAGAYGIQDDWGAVFVKRIDGDYYNVMGLPLHSLYKQLKDFVPEMF